MLGQYTEKTIMDLVYSFVSIHPGTYMHYYGAFIVTLCLLVARYDVNYFPAFPCNP
jgi:hypothetical protein